MASEALNQVHEKQYHKSYLHRNKSIVIIGANFSSDLRNISDWKGEVLNEKRTFLRSISME